jgi:hypothetical protein
MTKPIKLNIFGHHHPLASASTLMSHYGLSLTDPLRESKPRATSCLDNPVDGRNLAALSHSGTSEICQFGSDRQDLINVLSSFRPVARKAPSRLSEIFEKIRPGSFLTQAESSSPFDVYEWNNWFLACREPIIVGDADPCLLFLHVELTSEGLISTCYDPDCFWSTASPLTSSCCIRLNVNMRNVFKKIGRIRHLPAANFTRLLILKTPYGSNYVKRLRMFIKDFICELNNNNIITNVEGPSSTTYEADPGYDQEFTKNPYITNISRSGDRPIFSKDMKIWTDGSMIKDKDINYSSSSAILKTQNGYSHFKIAIEHDKPSLFRAELWGII